MGSFRIYCLEQANIVLLIGGHKDTQSKDIDFAKQILKGVIDGQVRTEIYE
jgi:putative component of toxin-antitoxin plasmid stabilization module